MGEAMTGIEALRLDERVGRLEQQLRGLVDLGREENRLSREAAGTLRELSELVGQERADRLNMAHKLDLLNEWATGELQQLLNGLVDTIASEEADNRNARRRLGELELKVDELARRMHAGQPGFDFPWPPIPRENEQAPTVHDLERDTEDRLAEQPVTEQTAERSQRLNDILLNVALAAERHHAIGLSTSDTEILNEYLDGLDPHCAVAEVSGG